jgi:hypothetical protein
VSKTYTVATSHGSNTHAERSSAVCARWCPVALCGVLSPLVTAGAAGLTRVVLCALRPIPRLSFAHAAVKDASRRCAVPSASLTAASLRADGL